MTGFVRSLCNSGTIDVVAGCVWTSYRLAAVKRPNGARGGEKLGTGEAQKAEASNNRQIAEMVSRVLTGSWELPPSLKMT